MLISVKVVPGSGSFKVLLDKDGNLKVYLKSKAEANKANIELIKRMGKFLGTDVSLVSGKSSRKKVLEADISKEEFDSIVSDLGE